ncbi:hypothetical protein [uncultured Gammaproteobacteria bacterium]|nr:hypothetical protein [uncultured Gammaproteobacteria bacterium]CAC9622600.1 hypothetical protein [uncultured Gammaproteobacteria bacterium]
MKKVLNERDIEKLKIIADKWNLIEKRLKITEKYRFEVDIPAINELRYAGRKIVDIIVLLHSEDYDNETEKTISDNIAHAEQYCMNSDHDLTDGICTFFNTKMERVINDYGYDNVCTYFPQTSKIMVMLDEVKEVISISRENRPQRVEAYKKLEEEFIPKFMAFHKQLVASEKSMLLSKRTRERKDKILIFFAVIGIIVGISGVLISIL